MKPLIAIRVECAALKEIVIVRRKRPLPEGVRDTLCKPRLAVKGCFSFKKVTVNVSNIIPQCQLDQHRELLQFTFISVHFSNHGVETKCSFQILGRVSGSEESFAMEGEGHVEEKDGRQHVL